MPVILRLSGDGGSGHHHLGIGHGCAVLVHHPAGEGAGLRRLLRVHGRYEGWEEELTEEGQRDDTVQRGPVRTRASIHGRPPGADARGED